VDDLEDSVSLRMMCGGFKDQDGISGVSDNMHWTETSETG